MKKRSAAFAALAATAGFLALFLGLTVHSHTRIPELTHQDRITPQVLAGKDVWHRANCVNCHTLLGEGAYYAPDLTRITAQRGAVYLTAFLAKPSMFYSEEVNRRLMTDPQLTPAEIAELVAFLEWINGIDNFQWPPRPINVAGKGAL